MYSLLIAIIYIAFISLGLPDSLLGSAWPVMQLDFDVALSYAGLVSIIISCGTVFSSLMSDRITKKLGTGLVTALSTALSALALFGFSVSNNIVLVCIFAVPYGLSAGSIDAAINNYVAIHYSSRHMSWLHCFWGLGATISPYIMSYSLSIQNNWHMGYRNVSIIQVVIAIILFVSIPLWTKKENLDAVEKRPYIPLKQVINIKNVKYMLVAFFSYCGLESTCGLWASSYLSINKGIDPKIVAMFGSFFFIGITFGRFLCGFIANKIGDKNMIRLGYGIILLGLILMIIPTEFVQLSLAGLIVVGLGCAPVYPSSIHTTPTYFGKENSQAIVGVQMASAYMGTTLLPPLFGLIANNIDIGLFPIYLGALLVLCSISTELLNRKMK